jgi:hypothetical protein
MVAFLAPLLVFFGLLFSIVSRLLTSIVTWVILASLIVFYIAANLPIPFSTEISILLALWVLLLGLVVSSETIRSATIDFGIIELGAVEAVLLFGFFVIALVFLYLLFVGIFTETEWWKLLVIGIVYDSILLLSKSSDLKRATGGSPTFVLFLLGLVAMIITLLFVQKAAGMLVAVAIAIGYFGRGLPLITVTFLTLHVLFRLALA